MREIYRLALEYPPMRSFEDYPDVVRLRASVPSGFKLMMAILAAFWGMTVVVASATFIGAIRNGVDEVDVPGVPSVAATPEAAPAPPFGVPAAAVPVEGPVRLGDIDDAIVFWHGSECRDGLLTIFTNKVALYREYDCGQLPPEQELARLPGQPVRIRTEGDALLVEALFVGVFRFPRDRWWALPLEQQPNGL